MWRRCTPPLLRAPTIRSWPSSVGRRRCITPCCEARRRSVREGLLSLPWPMRSSSPWAQPCVLSTSRRSACISRCGTARGRKHWSGPWDMWWGLRCLWAGRAPMRCCRLTAGWLRRSCFRILTSLRRATLFTSMYWVRCWPTRWTRSPQCCLGTHRCCKSRRTRTM